MSLYAEKIWWTFRKRPAKKLEGIQARKKSRVAPSSSMLGALSVPSIPVIAIEGIEAVTVISSYNFTINELSSTRPTSSTSISPRQSASPRIASSPVPYVRNEREKALQTSIADKDSWTAEESKSFVDLNIYSDESVLQNLKLACRL